MIAFRYQDTFNAFAIFKLKHIFACAVFGSSDVIDGQAIDRKMIGQTRPHIFG